MEKLFKCFELKQSSLAQDGTFEGMAAVYGNRDLGGDVIEPGAFDKTLKDRGEKKIPILWQHDANQTIGVIQETKDGSAGLFIRGKLTLAVGKAREAYELMKDGALGGLSIGYEVIRKNEARGTRYLKEIKLWEVSLVTFPMNELAQVSSVKTGPAGADWSEVAALLSDVNCELREMKASSDARQLAEDQRRTARTPDGHHWRP